MNMRIKLIISIFFIPLNLFVYWIFYSFDEIAKDLFLLLLIFIMELWFLFIPRYSGLTESIDFITHKGNKEDEIDSNFDKALSSLPHQKKIADDVIPPKNKGNHK